VIFLDKIDCKRGVKASSNAILALAIAVSRTALASAIASFNNFEFAICFLPLLFFLKILSDFQSN
jgi:hypothetical protein